MHSFYDIADIGYGRELLKLYVEELNNANSSNNTHRAYQLQNIEKQKLSAKGSQKKSASPVVSASVLKIISDLFTLVKRNDYRFNPNTASKVVDKNAPTLTGTMWYTAIAKKVMRRFDISEKHEIGNKTWHYG